MPSRYSILIVDDEPAVRTSTALVLETDYDVFQASNEKEALTLLSANNEIAAVLLDIRLYGRDQAGISLLSTIKARWPIIEVIMITAVTDLSQALSYFEKGAYYYLTKPFKHPELKAMLKNAVEKWQRPRGGRKWAAGLSSIAKVPDELQALANNKQVHFNKVMRDLQRRLILGALKASKGKKTVAAELLKLHRNSLAVKMASLKISVNRLKGNKR
jgi:DNA-binding NtrC family response regulator